VSTSPKEVAKIYASLLASSPDLPHASLAQIFEYASTMKDTDLLIALAGHPALTDDLDDAISAIPTSLVQAAWADRPGRSPAQLNDKAINDSRVAVSELLASRPNLSKKAYTTLASSKSRRVAFALVENEAAPLAARAAAATRVASGIDREKSYMTKHRYEQLFKNHTDVVPALVKAHLADPTNDTGYIYDCYFSNKEINLHVPVVTHAVAVSGLFSYATHLVEALPSTQNASSYIARTASYQVQQVISLAASVVASAKATPVDAQALIEALEASPLFPDKAYLAEVLSFLSGSRPDQDTFIPSLAVSSDVAYLKEIASTFDASLGDPALIAKAIMTNPHASIDVIQAVIDRWPIGGNGRSLNLDRVLYQWAKSQDIVMLLFKTSLTSTLRLSEINDKVLASMNNTDDVITMFISTGNFPYWLVSSSLITPQLASNIAVSRLTRVGTEEINTKALDYLSSSLGDSPRAWAMCQDLIEGFPGSVADLAAQINSLLRAESSKD